MSPSRAGRAAMLALLTALTVASSAGCSARFDWRELRSSEGFVAVLPGRPQEATREIQLPAGPATMTMWSAGVGSTLFAVGAARLPPAAVADPAARAATMAYFRDGLLRNIGAAAGAERRSAPPPPGSPDARKLLAAEAVEAVGRAGPDGRAARLAARFFIVDDRLFQVVALGAEGEIPPAALETFFTAFRLTS